jgi:hypothetical protein
MGEKFEILLRFVQKGKSKIVLIIASSTRLVMSIKENFNIKLTYGLLKKYFFVKTEHFWPFYLLNLPIRGN